jgi:hypothetical protein
MTSARDLFGIAQAAMGKHHKDAQRQPDVLHMCPEFGCTKVDEGRWVANPLCPVCQGVGLVDESTVARWVAEQHAKARRGEI